PIVVGNDGTNGGLGAATEVNKVSCASCHDSANWYVDTRSRPRNTSLGVNWDIRNSATLVNAQYYKWVENDGFNEAEWQEAITAVELFWVMGGSRLRVAHAIYDHYRDDYNAVFADAPLDPSLAADAPDAARFPPDGLPKALTADGANAADGPWEAMSDADHDIVNRIFVNFAKACGAYVRLLVSRNAPFDKYVAGDYGALPTDAKDGLKLFIGKANCVHCHKSPHFSDDDFHNTGWAPDRKQVHLLSPPPGGEMGVVEDGRFTGIVFVTANEFNSDSKWSDDQHTGKLTDLVAKESDKGKWRTKGLRSIAKTDPFFHNGQFPTLPDVLKFYNNGGADADFIGTKDEVMKKLNLSDGELSNLDKFLGQLTGDPIPSFLQTDTSAP
ncbi:MAG TPA: cytochrome c peroxidase, partial [Polyangiaceae bacterium]|nr:cytochrome c peroxidase [Polyangiaceae bacterium]